jgi:hypothetical protein
VQRTIISRRSIHPSSNDANATKPVYHFQKNLFEVIFSFLRLFFPLLPLFPSPSPVFPSLFPMLKPPQPVVAILPGSRRLF